MADQLVTKAQVKARLGITDVTDDALIDELIEQVTDWVQEYTGRKLVAEAGATYYVDTGPGSVIQVPRGIRLVTTLGIATTDQPDTGGTYTTVTSTVVLRPSSMDRRPGWPATEIWLVGSAPRLVEAINGAKIVGDFGFATVPPEIQGVAIDAVVSAYTTRRAGASSQLGADELATGAWSTFFGWGSPQRGTLMRYRAGRGIA
jgi:hypothetical protein